MKRLSFCACGGTAWKDREEGQYLIHCDKCGTAVGHDDWTECRYRWQLEQQKLKRRLAKEEAAAKSN